MMQYTHDWHPVGAGLVEIACPVCKEVRPVPIARIDDRACVWFACACPDGVTVRLLGPVAGE